MSSIEKKKGKGKEKEKEPPPRKKQGSQQTTLPGITIHERSSRPRSPSDDSTPSECPSPGIADVPTQLPDFIPDVDTSSREYKVYLEPDGKSGFIPSKPAAAALTKVIRARYSESLLSWREIPLTTRKMLFREFQNDVWWNEECIEQMWDAFNTRCYKRLSNLLGDARATKQRPNWVSERVWKELLIKWSSPNYISKCKKVKINRASNQGACLHTSDCVSTITTVKRLVSDVICLCQH